MVDQRTLRVLKSLRVGSNIVLEMKDGSSVTGWFQEVRDDQIVIETSIHPKAAERLGLTDIETVSVPDAEHV